jgi:hypothetical protein
MRYRSLEQRPDNCRTGRADTVWAKEPCLSHLSSCGLAFRWRGAEPVASHPSPVAARLGVLTFYFEWAMSGDEGAAPKASRWPKRSPWPSRPISDVAAVVAHRLRIER